MKPAIESIIEQVGSGGNVMRIEDLTKEFEKRITDEIRSVYHYLGEYDEEFIQEISEKRINELQSDLRLKPAEEIETEDGIAVGYRICVGLGGDDDYYEIMYNGKLYEVDHVISLNLLVNTDGFQYILEHFDAYHLPGTDMKEDVYRNIMCKKVKLKDVDKEVVRRAF